MKIISLIIFLFGSYSLVQGQYKNMTVGVFGGTHNFKSNYFNTGLSVQYNFKKAISINSGLSYERMTAKTASFNEFGSNGFTYYHTNWKIPYIQVPLNVRATFGRKVCFYFELGVAYSFFNRITAEVVSSYIYNSPEPQSSTVLFEHDKTNLFMFTLGGGVGIPIADKLLIQFSVRRSMMRNEFSFSDDIFYNYFRSTPGFCGVKFMLGIAYQFNFSKKREYPIERFKIKKY